MIGSKYRGELFLVLVVSSLSCLMALAFFTLLERKVIGHINIRKGPNKVRVGGIFQPLSDAGKLVFKQRVKLAKYNFIGFLIAPVFALRLILCLWVMYPRVMGGFSVSFSGVVFLVISRLTVYALLGAGWCSNRKFSLYGVVRGVAQRVSYEVRLALFLISLFILVSRFSLFGVRYSNRVVILRVVPFTAGAWMISCVAESNRAPFDFAEGESELVSGFNIEYGGRGFALIFMAEYARILIIRMFSIIFFLSFGRRECFIWWIYGGGVVISFIYVGVRACLPRLRYDMLMRVAWKGFLPLSLSLLVFLSGIVLFI